MVCEGAPTDSKVTSIMYYSHFRVYHWFTEGFHSEVQCRSSNTHHLRHMYKCWFDPLCRYGYNFKVNNKDVGLPDKEIGASAGSSAYFGVLILLCLPPNPWHSPIRC